MTENTDRTNRGTIAPSDLSPDDVVDSGMRRLIKSAWMGDELPEDLRDDMSRGDLKQEALSVTGRVTEIDDSRTRVIKPVFECQRCCTPNPTVAPPFGTRPLPTPDKCKGCERSGPFRIDDGKSEFTEEQTVTVSDCATSDGSHSSAKTILRGDLVGSVCVGDIITFDAVYELDQSGPTANFDGYLIVLSEPDIDRPGWSDYVPETPTPAIELDAFIDRSRAVLNCHDALDETETKAKIITPFISTLGWDVQSPSVRMEYTSDSGIDDRVDYALLRDDSPYAVIEAKGARRNIGGDVGQLKRYMRLFGCDVGLLTNGSRYIFLQPTDEGDAPNEEVVLDCELEDLPDRGNLVSFLRGRSDWDFEVPDEPDPGAFDAGGPGSGTHPQRFRQQSILKLVESHQGPHPEGVSKSDLVGLLEQEGTDTSEFEDDIEDLRYMGELYVPAFADGDEEVFRTP